MDIKHSQVRPGVSENSCCTLTAVDDAVMAPDAAASERRFWEPRGQIVTRPAVWVYSTALPPEL